jgi:aspartyl protease family protein
VNNGDQALALVYLIGCLVLVASGLAVRRLPLGQTVKMALAWMLIFAAGFVIFALRDDFRALGGRILAEVRGEAGQETKSGELRIRRADDGHFWADGEVNGRAVRFLVDSGATVTTITHETAERVGIAPGGGFGVMVDTANGSVMVQRGRAERVKIGPIERSDLAVHISSTLGDTDILGMNFLSTLTGWGVEGSVLVLKA